MTTSNDQPNLKQVDITFLAHIQIGDRLFHYPRVGTAEKSFQQSPSAAFILYSVIELPTSDDIILLGAFQPDEEKMHKTRSQLLAGDWWYIPETK